jgi:hypothetical protein
MTNIYAVHQQWASRPDDQRFLSLDELLWAAYTAQRPKDARSV